MNWQEWVVGLLIVLCVARILYGIYLFFRRVKENDNPCASCASGCELKDMMEKKQKECSSKKKNTKKSYHVFHYSLTIYELFLLAFVDNQKELQKNSKLFVCVFSYSFYFYVASKRFYFRIQYICSSFF